MSALTLTEWGDIAAMEGLESVGTYEFISLSSTLFIHNNMNDWKACLVSDLQCITHNAHCTMYNA